MLPPLSTRSPLPVFVKLLVPAPLIAPVTCKVPPETTSADALLLRLMPKAIVCVLVELFSMLPKRSMALPVTLKVPAPEAKMMFRKSLNAV